MENFYRLLCTFIWIFTALFCAAEESHNLVCDLSSDSVSSHVTKEHIVLAFNTPFNYPLDLTTRWDIKKEDSDKILKHGVGPIRNLIFEIPGTYIVDLVEKVNHDPKTCNHPQHPEKITISVSPFRMEFDFSTLRLSQEIVGGKPVDGQTVSVDVFFDAYGKDSADYKILPFRSSGTGTTIIGTPLYERVLLQLGTNTLTYRLSGQAHRDSYIMFDFLDINNQVQVYSLPQKIK